MGGRKFITTKPHKSEYPEPITFVKGAPLVVGERYKGPEGWKNWFFCNTPGQKGGWVPDQVIEHIDDGAARAREDYTARELDVQEGESLFGSKILNGWLWCENADGSKFGWVPLAKLKEIEE